MAFDGDGGDYLIRVASRRLALAALIAARRGRRGYPKHKVFRLPPDWIAEIQRIRALTPESRMLEIKNFSAFMAEAKRIR